MSMEEMSRIFVEGPSFTAKWKALGLTDADLRRLQMMLLDDPKVGAVMRGTGGIRKVRFAYGDRGKSGSVRVIYVDFEVYEKIYLLTVYEKSKKDNLTKQERNIMHNVVSMIEMDLEKGTWKNE